MDPALKRRLDLIVLLQLLTVTVGVAALFGPIAALLAVVGLAILVTAVLVSPSIGPAAGG